MTVKKRQKAGEGNILVASSTKAFSLIELMITVLILVMLLPSLLRGITGYFLLNSTTRDNIIATVDARMVIEQMRSLSKTASSLAEITGANWTAWAANNGVNNLPSEIVTVSYTDLDSTNSSLDDDPLAITVDVGWQGNRTRTNNLTFSTLITLY